MYEIYLVFHHLAGGIEKWREKKKDFRKIVLTLRPVFGNDT